VTQYQTTGKYMSTNNDPFAPWNNPMVKDDPFAPHNDTMRKNSPFEEWNNPFGDYNTLSHRDKEFYRKYR